MKKENNLEIKGVCQYESELDLAYGSDKGQDTCEIKSITWKNVDISGDINTAVYTKSYGVKWYDKFIVVSMGKRPAFNDGKRRDIAECLDANQNLLAYCDEQSLAFIVSKKHRYCESIAKMFITFLGGGWRITSDGTNINVRKEVREI